MMDGDISTMKADELEQIEDNNKKFLYPRAVHANNMIQHHMHEILEHQRVVDEYRSMADGERDVIPLESDQYKNDLVINQQIMQMIDADIFWYEKTFRAILMELQKIWDGETIAQSSKELGEGILMELRKIWNGETIVKTSKEHSEDKIYCHDESHAIFDDQRLYKGEKHTTRWQSYEKCKCYKQGAEKLA